MSNGIGKENDLTIVDTITVNDFVRVVKGGSSRRITLSNFIAKINQVSSNLVNVLTVTANYIASATNNVILADMTAGALMVTLPAASASEGFVITIKKIDATTNDITVQAVSGLIDGSASATLSGSGGARPSAAFVCDGSNWHIING